MLQVKSIRKMNQHSGFPLLASSNYSRRKRKYWFNLGTDVSYNMYTNFLSHRLWCIYFGSLVSNLHRNHLSIAVLTLWVAPPKMFGSILFRFRGTTYPSPKPTLTLTYLEKNVGVVQFPRELNWYKCSTINWTWYISTVHLNGAKTILKMKTF